MSALAYLVTRGGAAFRVMERAYVAYASRSMLDAVAQRDARRGGDRFRWLTPEEAQTAAALAGLIVPSDEETPGMDEVCILGPAAVDELDRLIDASTHRRDVYSRGLLAFDVWATEAFGRTFPEIDREQQTVLLQRAQFLYEGWRSGPSIARKAWLRLQSVARASGAALVAAQLYPLLRYDCLRVFYTSRVSWVWLGYDGPPMYKGYSSLVVPR
jgi:hypothetical protein